ncbi:MAG: hypothetical protein HUJ61_06840, partial [Bacilli bacterium]|nr:hypothetical protein [Bacilli bacterium]
YVDVMSKLKLEKNGEGYDLSTEYKNSLFGGLEAAKNKGSNLKHEIDDAFSKCVDPQKLDKANKAFNLSKNIFPGGMSFTDMKEGRWSKLKVCHYFNTKKEEIMNAWVRSGKDPVPFNQLLDGSYMDDEGNVWVKDKCEYKKLDLPLLPEEEQYEEEIMSSAPGSNQLMVCDDELITITQGALKIKNESQGNFAKECESLSEFINSWKRNADGVKRYANQII